MAESTREVWITGIGVVSCLGEGPDAHWQKLMEAHPAADTTTFAPFVVHPFGADRYVCGRACARFGRSERQNRHSLADGHDCRRGRWRARSDRRLEYPQRYRTRC